MTQIEFTPARRAERLPPNFWGAMDREVARLRTLPGPEMIDVSKGNPDLPTAPHIVRAMQEQVADPRNHRYPSYAGRPALLRAIAARYREDHGVSLDPDGEIAVFHGSHEGLMSAILSLADPGDTVVLPDPGYPMYLSAVSLAEAHLATVPLVGDRYAPDFAALSSIDRARVVMLNYPNNPTGAVAERGFFDDALTFAERTGAAFVHDFAYGALGFDAPPLSAFVADPDKARTVELQTLSKTYSMAGWRVGYAVGNASVIDAMKRYQAHAFSTMFGATQEAAAAALSGDQQGAADLVEVYRRRRDLVVAGLRDLGWRVIEPAGSFFVWVELPAGTDAVRFATELREEARVAVAPGDGFGARGRGHLRLSTVHDEATLTELIERLTAFARSR